MALYTSAAPTFFPAVDGYIDGGVFANNPSMAALAQTQDHRALQKPPRHDRIALLSIGTGTSLMRIERKNLEPTSAPVAQRYGGASQVIGLDAVDRIPDATLRRGEPASPRLRR